MMAPCGIGEPIVRVVSFGECMIELARKADGSAQMGYGGDTLNTAIYLARLGVDTAYMTALGDDVWSHDMKAAWAREGVTTSLVLTHPTRAPGLYGIATDAQGERTFTYWRDQSAVRAFFDCPGADDALAKASSATVLYLSGISLAVLSATLRRRLIVLARAIHSNGGQVVFDPNYRPRLWASVAEFQTAVIDIAPTLTAVLPSFDDEASVWGDVDATATMARWQGLCGAEVVVKDGAKGALTVAGLVPAQPVTDVIDTTGAGDSFNAGYLARRMAGDGPIDAAEFGARLAGDVVRHRGAIIPREAMPRLEAVA
jgi:2-dehydro-3-deoxygluconokinase